MRDTPAAASQTPDSDRPARAPDRSVAVVGAGPAGLMAAEVLALGGIEVDLFDAMPSPGRKFLLAGIGGLNLTHAEPFVDFCQRFGDSQDWLAACLDAFPPTALRGWAHDLGVETFVGSSGRVFPLGMKAAPLLRRWLQRLRGHGVRLHVRHRWQGWDAAGRLRFATPTGEQLRFADATVLALGGASWPQLGSDGAWVPILADLGVGVQTLAPANCGFEVPWSAHLRERFAGAPLKSVVLSLTGVDGTPFRAKGELVITAHGIEGSLVYACSQPLRRLLQERGRAEFLLDLLPDHSTDRVAAAVAHPRGARSLSSHLQSRLGLTGVKVALLHEVLGRAAGEDPQRLAATVKALPITVHATRPIAEAISSAGGVHAASVDAALMLRARPGVFVAGEMLDWEAPTGGYLLSACLATGRHAGRGALNWVAGPGAAEAEGRGARIRVTP